MRTKGGEEGEREASGEGARPGAGQGRGPGGAGYCTGSDSLRSGRTICTRSFRVRVFCVFFFTFVFVENVWWLWENLFCRSVEIWNLLKIFVRGLFFYWYWKVIEKNGDHNMIDVTICFFVINILILKGFNTCTCLHVYFKLKFVPLKLLCTLWCYGNKHTKWILSVNDIWIFYIIRIVRLK